ncbi:hypothetical protein, partial [Pseudomonas viridiflava]|uniref:hypothetical protein n=1 Tax=Pseudomonas viridiflava TaxID=33069 RepID=UPI00198091B6
AHVYNDWFSVDFIIHDVLLLLCDVRQSFHDLILTCQLIVGGMRPHSLQAALNYNFSCGPSHLPMQPVARKMCLYL